MQNKIITSPIHYMGNKKKLLKQLLPLFPECDTFFDAMGGGAVVSMNFKGKYNTVYNEVNPHVLDLVKMLQNNTYEDLNSHVEKQIKAFNIICPGKDYRANMHLQKGYYDFREYYNKQTNKDIRDLFILINFSINHLVRFNKQNEFNAPAGSTQKYTADHLQKGIDAMKGVTIIEEDIFNIDYSNFTKDDFIYFDPPYTGTSAPYNEKRAFGGWTLTHDMQLFDLLEKLNEKGIRWGLSNIFKNRGKENLHTVMWCMKNKWNVAHLNRNYHPFSAFSGNTDEVYIYNYELEDEEEKA